VADQTKVDGWLRTPDFPLSRGSWGEEGMMNGQGGAARSISNEDLTELALDSAIALDRRLQSKEGDQEVISKFLDVLETLVNVDRDQAARMLVSDPRKVSVVNRAFRYINRETPPTVHALITNINRMAENYRRPSASQEDIERLRNFCIALHKELLAYTHGSYENERSRESIDRNATRLL
jgi:hypothetical protein